MDKSFSFSDKPRHSFTTSKSVSLEQQWSDQRKPQTQYLKFGGILSQI